ncbi:MAG TPA: tRNA pseudouridine(55) synthase TruB [Flavobacteriales bacterium]|nr:tRNA pseudouridine(55) synthase TruB [Flavobacteriales bacterium]HAW20683.1 tRNA pseudouridine(55) synthase TruB [Flavobacteriales bacterium]
MDQPPFGLTVLVDKPLTWTSFDVVNKLRYTAKSVTGRKKIKVGHAGTLDPLATGLLIICVGSHTKTINEMVGLTKRYEGTFRLGSTTPSYDLETEPENQLSIPVKDIDLLEKSAQLFRGDIIQTPPIYSAKKVDGKKAYLMARKGKDIEMRPAPIHISSLEIEVTNYPDIDFKMECSKGTYVRSLAHDFGQAMGCGAHLARLNRTQIGSFNLKDALSIEQASQFIELEYSNYLKTSVI